MSNAVEGMRLVEEPRQPLSMNPKRFAMWLFLSTVVMLFASLTSAYIVRQAEGNWLYFELPRLFYITSFVIIISSVTMQLAYFAAKAGNAERLRFMITFTAVLGLVFLVGQFMAWADLVGHSVHLVGNPSGSFLYILTGLHGLHVVSAVVFLLIVLNAAYRGKISPGKLLPIELCTTYWHFLGVLWLYLFIFLLLTR